jgi:hypothetical protein
MHTPSISDLKQTNNSSDKQNNKKNLFTFSTQSTLFNENSFTSSHNNNLTDSTAPAASSYIPADDSGVDSSSLSADVTSTRSVAQLPFASPNSFKAQLSRLRLENERARIEISNFKDILSKYKS